MSFADAVREELCEAPVKSPCCRHALTDGLLIAARGDNGRDFAVRYRTEPVATLASAMIKRTYGVSPESEMTGACGHRYYDLTFSSPAFGKLFRRRCEGGALAEYKCESCHAAFLRGVFLAVGTVNDPQKSFHLEFLMPSEVLAEGFSGFLCTLGYPPKTMRRAGGIGVYIKNSGSIEELIGLAGAQHTIFEIINHRIERDIRNNENRATNCVAKNIEKTISAATAQLEAIGLLMEHGRLERLPEALRESAGLRYQNPDATLDELAAMHPSPISKSGLNHRLSKIMEAAEEIKGQ